jgi:hypothetical protein
MAGWNPIEASPEEARLEIKSARALFAFHDLRTFLGFISVLDFIVYLSFLERHKCAKRK